MSWSGSLIGLSVILGVQCHVFMSSNWMVQFFADAFHVWFQALRQSLHCTL